MRLGDEDRRTVLTARLFLALWDVKPRGTSLEQADDQGRAQAALSMWEAITGLHGRTAIDAARQIASTPWQEEGQQ